MSKRPSPTKDAADELGLTRRRIQQIRKGEALDGAKEMARLRRAEKAVTIKLRQAQEEAIQADLRRKARIDAGELIHTDTANAIYVGALLELKTQLTNLPDRLAHQLRPDDPKFARDLLWSELARISELIQAKIVASTPSLPSSSSSSTSLSSPTTSPS